MCGLLFFRKSCSEQRLVASLISFFFFLRVRILRKSLHPILSKSPAVKERKKKPRLLRRLIVLLIESRKRKKEREKKEEDGDCR